MPRHFRYAAASYFRQLIRHYFTCHYHDFRFLRYFRYYAFIAIFDDYFRRAG
jgi:hypothetical protein